MLDVDNRLSKFQVNVNDQIRVSEQTVIALTDERIAARLADVDKIVATKVTETVDNA